MTRVASLHLTVDLRKMKMKSRKKSGTRYYIWIIDKGKPEAKGFKMFCNGHVGRRKAG